MDADHNIYVGTLLTTSHSEPGRVYRVTEVEYECICPDYLQVLAYGDSADLRPPHISLALRSVPDINHHDSFLDGYAFDELLQKWIQVQHPWIGPGFYHSIDDPRVGRVLDELIILDQPSGLQMDIFAVG